MIQTVVKRDGRIVGFNEEKIVAAIRKAMLHTEKGEDMSLIRQITDRIVCRGDEQMSVEAIQDCVERRAVVKMWLNVILLIGIKGVLPEKQKHVIFFWKLLKLSRTMLPAKTQI